MSTTTTDIELFHVEQGAVAVHADAERIKEEALALGALIGVVASEETNRQAVEALKGIQTVLKLAEETRTRVKAPVLDLARAIDARAKEYIRDLDVEFRRLSSACADWQTAQLERVRAQERARAEELARIEREKAEALRKIEEEERRKGEEARRRAAAEAAAARNEAERQAAEERAKKEAVRMAAEAEARLKAEEERRAQEQMALAPTPAPIRAEGQISKPVWLWEVTDIWTLARTQPGLVEITPRRQQINEVIVSLASAGPPKIAGLRIWEEMKVGVRLGRTPQPIDV